MANSIHKQTIYNERIGTKISPFQEKILDSYKLEEETFALTLEDDVTKEVHSFPRWESESKEDTTVYDYMKNKNMTIEELEINHQKILKANQKYDESLGATGV